VTRELARRFNHIYGREPGFEDKARAAVRSSAARRRALRARCARVPGKGRRAGARSARELLEDTQNLSLGDRERLFGYLEGARRVILPEPQPLLTETPRVPGLDGRRCPSPTATRSCCARIRLGHGEGPHDADGSGARSPNGSGQSGEVPRLGPAPDLLEPGDARLGVQGCTTAGIGCLECKQPVIDAIIREQQPIRERAQRYLDDPSLVRNIVADGCERARKLAEETMRDVARRWDFPMTDGDAALDLAHPSPARSRSPASMASRSTSCRRISTYRRRRSRSSSRPSKGRSTCCST
jgi:tryptophanyl-tRNA synthetase